MSEIMMQLNNTKEQIKNYLEKNEELTKENNDLNK